MMKMAFAIPAYNESDRLNQTLQRLDRWLKASKAFAQFELICVITDDGSTPEVQVLGQEKDKQDFAFKIVLLRHICNLGQGAAIQTSTEYAIEVCQADIVVHMDSDGQHRPGDLPALVAPILEQKADIVFGNRFHNQDSTNRVPKSRRVLLKLASIFERWLTGLALTDAHNGYRALSRKVAETMVIHQNRMAHATEIKQWVSMAAKSQGIRYLEVPVTIDYSDETLLKGQRGSGALRILKELFDSYLFGD